MASLFADFEIDDQLDLAGLLDRQVCRLLALEYGRPRTRDTTGLFREALGPSQASKAFVTRQPSGIGAIHLVRL